MFCFQTIFQIPLFKWVTTGLMARGLQFLESMNTELSPKEIGQRIFFIRGHRVMLDSDLSYLYCTDTRALNRAVRRNIKRFPAEFMFQLTKIEHENLMYQSGTSSLVSHGGRRKLPLVFSEYGVVMLSSVLGSDHAIQVNIAIVKAFVRLRDLMESNRELAIKLEQIEKKLSRHDHDFKSVFEAIRQLMATGSPVRQKKIKALGE